MEPKPNPAGCAERKLFRDGDFFSTLLGNRIPALQVRQDIGYDLERADPGGLVVNHSGEHKFIGTECVDQSFELPPHSCGRTGRRAGQGLPHLIHDSRRDIVIEVMGRER